MILADVIEERGLSLEGTIAVRHTPKEAKLKSAWSQITSQRRDLLVAYQRLQLPPRDSMFRKATTLLAFTGDRPGEADFIGAWHIRGASDVDAVEFAQRPEQRELARLAGPWVLPWPDTVLVMDLEELTGFEGLIGRLRIGWSSELAWVQHVRRDRFPVLSPDAV